MGLEPDGPRVAEAILDRCRPAGRLDGGAVPNSPQFPFDLREMLAADVVVSSSVALFTASLPDRRRPLVY